MASSGVPVAAALDHVILFCAAGAPEAELLRARGFTEGSRNVHTGQGTANRRFFFESVFIELLWVNDAAEAQSEIVRPTGLWDRWQRLDGSCPLALVFRPNGASAEEPPFPTWPYFPPYLPEGMAIEVGAGVRPAEPLLFYLPFVRSRVDPHPEPIVHEAAIRDITGVLLTIPDTSSMSVALQQIVAAGLMHVRSGAEYLLELQFVGDRTTALDLRPDLPLVFVPWSR
jgi:hypothetical protein